MSLKLDKAYLAVYFPKEVAEVGTNWAPGEKSLETQKEMALRFLPERLNEILEDIKRAAAENKTSCSTEVNFHGLPYDQKWSNAFKTIFQRTLQVTIHEPIINGCGYPSEKIKATWESQQNKAIKQLLEIGPFQVRRYDENEKLNEFRKSPNHKYCDFTFIVRDQQFPVHKVILAKNSDFFDQLFIKAFRDGVDNEPLKFGANTLTPDIFEAFLEYLYTNVIDLETKDMTFVIELSTLAQSTEVQSLVDLCHSSIRQRIEALQEALKASL
jgi:hypothetical protein